MKFRRPALAFYAGVLIVTAPFFTIFLLWKGPDMSSEQVLQQRIAELHERLKHAEMLNQERRRDIVSLRRNFGLVLQATNLSSRLNSSHAIKMGRGELWEETQRLLNSAKGTLDLQTPSIHHYLPHLQVNPDSLQPAFKVAKGINGVSLVLGIPTVKRDVQSYLYSTLQNLIENMSPDEKLDAVIIVFIAEVDADYVSKQVAEIESLFKEHLDSGLLEVISPPESYYPDFETLRKTLGDPLDRVKWRTKQNLDFAYLMMYAQAKGTFYVQLEDDILTKPGYITTMKNFALKQLYAKKDWLVLDFCQLGFIGKLFKCVDLSKLVVFFLMFHNDKPVDWLLDNLIQTKVCRFDKDLKDCRKQKDQVWIHYKPSLFQHVGTHSSLKGKVQKLKDKQFGKLQLFHPHKNPPAEVGTSLKAYKMYSLQRAYKGDIFFWSLLPQRGDTLFFRFKPPVVIEKFLFRSGNAEHPDDKFTNTTVEILPIRPPPDLALTKTSDGFYVVGRFKDSSGVAEGVIPPSVGPVQEMRLFIHTDSDHWIILSEIHVMPSNLTSAPKR